MTTSITETRPEYMTDDQLDAAWRDTLEAIWNIETVPFDAESFLAFHEEQDQLEDRLLSTATEMQQRSRLKGHVGPVPPLPIIDF
jgi:hypothetical protein